MDLGSLRFARRISEFDASNRSCILLYYMTVRICQECRHKLQHYAKGMCRKCYDRKRIKIYCPPFDLESAVLRFWSHVNKTSDCWLWTLRTNKKGYGQFTVGRRTFGAHRFAYEQCVGIIPLGMSLDHRYTCPKNCVRPDHLRLATSKQQNENLASARRHSKTGIRGVFPHKSGKWYAAVRHNGKLYYLGLFADINDADQAVRSKRNELYTHNDADRLSC